MSPRDRSMRGMASLWLGLVEQRCLKLAVGRDEHAMGPAERVKLLDAALRSGYPAAYLDRMRLAFEASDRQGDAVLSAVLCGLARAGEIETLMFVRAEWQDSEDAPFSNPDLAL